MEKFPLDDDQWKLKETAARAAHALEFNTRNSGLVGRNLAATFSNFQAAEPKQRKVLDAVQNFAKTFTSTSGGGLWLLGTPGSGKTHLGAAMVSKSICERGLGASMFSLLEILAMMRARWGKNKETLSFWAREDGLETSDQLIAHLGSIPLLVIDELGVGRGTDFELETVFQIVDRRYALQRPTVILSNLTVQELKPALGDRSYDRLREGTTLLTLDWPSHRGQNPDHESQTAQMGNQRR